MHAVARAGFLHTHYMHAYNKLRYLLNFVEGIPTHHLRSMQVPTAENIPALLNDVARLLRRNFNRRAQPLGLTQVQWRALAHLARSEGMHQIELAELLEIQPITAARLIDRLETAGWVERCPDPADRRAVRLHLTAKAAPVIGRIRALASETRTDAFAGLSPTALEAFTATLQTIKENLARDELNEPLTRQRQKAKKSGYG